MNNGKIQFVDLVAQYQQIKPEIDAAMAKVCGRGDVILGEDMELFGTLNPAHTGWGWVGGD